MLEISILRPYKMCWTSITLQSEWSLGKLTHAMGNLPKSKASAKRDFEE